MIQQYNKDVSIHLLQLPEDVICVVLRFFQLRSLTKLCCTCKILSYCVYKIWNEQSELHESICVDAMDFILKYGNSLRVPPNFHGPKKIDKKTMIQLLKTWPNYMTLSWILSQPESISAFSKYAMNASMVKNLQHLVLNVTDIDSYSKTSLYFPSELELSSFSIDCNAISVAHILGGLRVRDWKVYQLSVRGNVRSLVDLLMYIPSVKKTISIINTEDSHTCIGVYETETAVRFLKNMPCAIIRLINLLPICSPMCHLCSHFQHGMISDYRRHSGSKMWKVSRLSAALVRTLLSDNCRVHCGVFEEEMMYIHKLQMLYPGMLFVDSVY